MHNDTSEQVHTVMRHVAVRSNLGTLIALYKFIGILELPFLEACCLFQ